MSKSIPVAQYHNDNSNEQIPTAVVVRPTQSIRSCRMRYSVIFIIFIVISVGIIIFMTHFSLYHKNDINDTIFL